MITRLISWLLFSPILTGWLLLCGAFAMVGRLFPRRHDPIDLSFVQTAPTICRILHYKGLLSKEEYDFEHVEVASLYDRMTFGGYLFILGPLLQLLKTTQFLDGFFMYLVRRWMNVHQHFLYQAQRPARWHVWVTYLCIGLAHNLGVFLHWLGLLDWIYPKANKA